MEEVSYTAPDSVLNLSAVISIFTIIAATIKLFFIIHDIG